MGAYAPLGVAIYSSSIHDKMHLVNHLDAQLKATQMFFDRPDAVYVYALCN